MSVIIRTSALPKLALCPCFHGAQGGVKVYAMRGTLSDEAFRMTNEGETFKCVECCEGDIEPDRVNDEGQCLHCHGLGRVEPLDRLDDRIAILAKENDVKLKPAADGVRWALETMQEIAGEGVNCITDEAELKVSIEGLDADGVADGNAPTVSKGFDLKTGKIANYMEQMAGYALGFMNKYFVDEYEMHLLFSDEKQVITHVFTYEEARRVVFGVRAKVLDGNRKPKVNPYCNWCEYATTCQERLDGAQRALEYANEINVREGLFSVVDNAEKLGDFLDACDKLRPLQQVAEGKARWRLEDDHPVKGWALTKVKGIRSVTPQSAIQHTKKLPDGEELTLEKLFRALGNLTPFQFRNIMASVNKPMPKRWSKQGRVNTYLMRKSNKAEADFD